MNRRGFIDSMIRAGVAAMALPAATTYARIWTPPRSSYVGIVEQLRMAGPLFQEPPLNLREFFSMMYAIDRQRPHPRMMEWQLDPQRVRQYLKLHT